jgi:hypothetical protein
LGTRLQIFFMNPSFDYTAFTVYFVPPFQCIIGNHQKPAARDVHIELCIFDLH